MSGKAGRRDGRPRRRREGLVVKELPEETLVYDLERHKAHCLADVSAAVWRSCDGRRTVAQIAAEAAERLGRPVPEHAAWLALRRLGRARLLEAPLAVAVPAVSAASSRREWLKQAALLGGISVLSITAPTAASAATCVSRSACEADTNPVCSGQPCCTTGANPAPPGTVCVKQGGGISCRCR